jgi:hypothetical protein
MADNLPRWMRDQVHKCRIAFGLDRPGYQLHIQRVKRINGDRAVAGYTESAARYERAYVQFRVRLDPSFRLEAVTHELLHAALGRQGEAVDIIISQLPKRQRAAALETWHAANEAAITQVARALTPIIARMALEETP